jgi:WD40 repeat protein
MLKKEREGMTATMLEILHFVIRTPVFLTIVVFTSLLGCSNESVSLWKAKEQASVCQTIEERNIDFADLNQDARSTTSPQVAGLYFATSSSLEIVYSLGQEELRGQLIEFDIAKSKANKTVPLDGITTGFTRISKDGRMVVSASKTRCPQDYFDVSRGCWDIRAWDIKTGQLFWMMRRPTTDLRDLAISNEGRGILYASDSLVLESPFPQLRGIYLGLSSIDRSIELVSVDFDRSGHLLAYATKETARLGGKTFGVVDVNDWDGQDVRMVTQYDLGFTKLYYRNHELNGIPLRLAFDLTGQWLAVQTKDSVEVLTVPSLESNHPAFHLPSNAAGVLTFNPRSSLLAIGYSHGLKVVGVPNMNVVSDKPGGVLTAIAFSPDGCLLAWGDTEGTVHIINAPAG